MAQIPLSIAIFCVKMFQQNIHIFSYSFKQDKIFNAADDSFSALVEEGLSAHKLHTIVHVYLRK